MTSGNLTNKNDVRIWQGDSTHEDGKRKLDSGKDATPGRKTLMGTALSGDRIILSLLMKYEYVYLLAIHGQRDMNGSDSRLIVAKKKYRARQD